MMRRTTCAHCRKKLEPGEYIHESCKAPYAEACGAKAERKAAKAIKTEAKEDRAETKRRKEAMKRVPDLIKEAQECFNKWVRLRDFEQPCISCGAPPPDLSKLHAGRDAGHFRSTGSASHLRYHPDNCNAQCVSCNQWGAGKAVDYRIRLLERIGRERVEALECNNAVKKWDKDELREIRDTYRTKANELARERR